MQEKGNLGQVVENFRFNTFYYKRDSISLIITTTKITLITLL